MRCIMDMDKNRLIVPGPGGIEMTLSPGSIVYPLEPTHSGHLLLPCSEFGKRPARETMSLMTGEHAKEDGEGTVPGAVASPAPLV